MKKTILFCCTVALLTVFTAAHLPAAVGGTDSIDTVLARADSLLQRGELDAARRAYKQALKQDRDAVRAYLGLGEIDFKKEKWASAGDYFGEVIKREPDNVAAHYYRGICYRETGKSKALLLRNIDWGKSKKHFLWVIQRDSTFRDVLYQYALRLRYNGKFKEAIELAQSQVRLRPELVVAQVGLAELYRSFIRHKSEKEVESWLRQHPWEQARHALGVLWRRKERLDSADSLFQAMLKQPLNMSRQPIWLSLARLNYQRGNVEAGQMYFWRAVDSIRTDVDAAFVFEDIKYLLKDRELNAYRKLNTAPAEIAFFREFWNRRDPTLAAAIQVRLAEHYRRLRRAEKDYEYDGFRTFFNNPDKFSWLQFPEAFYLNREFNDKGLVYIRHGEPDEREVTVGGVRRTNESWLYYQRGDEPRLTFHFFIDENATGNNWRLDAINTEPAWLSDRLIWGTLYHRLLTAQPIERISLENEMGEKSRDDVAVGFSSDRHTWPDTLRPLEFAFTTAAFRGANDSTLLEIYYAVPIYELARKLAKRGSVIIDQGLALHDTSWRLVRKLNRHSILRMQGQKYKKEDVFVDVFRATVPPDSYHVSIYAQPRQSRYLGGYNYDIDAPDFSVDSLMMSDVQLAYDVSSAMRQGKFVKNNLRVVVNPTHRFPKKKPIFVYFEVYHLQPDASGKSAFEAEYTMSLTKEKKSTGKKLFGFLGGGGKSSISMRTQREVTGRTSVEYIALNANKLKSGEYALQIKVTDTRTGKSAQKTLELTLF